MKTALITGITGQDGSYLSKLLLDKGYDVHGIIRRSSSFNTGRLMDVFDEIHAPNKKLNLHYGDITDSARLGQLMEEIKPDEVYNLAAQSHVRVSFDEPINTAEIVALGTLKILEAIRNSSHPDKIKFYQASSSEMYGLVQQIPQNEKTPFYPRSPYACSKVYAYWQVINYRESFNLHASNGILFNHESPQRGETFVTRKITRAVARILNKKQEKLYLGNLDAKRDWGFAQDYVEAMWLMLQQPKPDDYVIATGETKSVREFLSVAFSCVGLNWEDYVIYDERYARPSEVDILIGDASKAKKQLNWSPKTSFEELVKLMVKADLELEGISTKSPL